MRAAVTETPLHPREPARGRRGGERARGFTLLEVMVALAILAASLVVLLEIATNNVRATNHSKMITTATFLARGKIVELEAGILEKGFGEMDEEDHGSFDDEGLAQFRWDTYVEKIELPADMAQKTQETAGNVAQSTDPMQALTGLVGGMMSSFIEPIRLGLEASVRRVTLRVSWDEAARPEQSIELVTFMTDPVKLETSMPMSAGGIGGQAGTSGTSSTTGTGGTSGSNLGTIGPGSRR